MVFLKQCKYIVNILILLFVTLPSNATGIKPAMWKVEHQGTTSYLLGSIHMGSSIWYPLPDYINSAFDKSETLIVELDATATVNSAALTSAMTLPVGQTLKDKLSPKTYKKLETYLTDNGVSINALSQLKPWAVGVNIAVIPALKLGLTSQFGIDNKLISRAKNKSMTLIPLETIQFQIELISDLFTDEKKLIDTIDKSENEFNELVISWGNGDDIKINELINRQMNQVTRDVMLTKRNINWVKKLTYLFKNDKPYFIVVGAAHLVGDKGVPALLSDAGLKVTRIK